MDAKMVSYEDEVHREEVMALWRDEFSYDAPHNDPARSIDCKCAIDDHLFLVAVNAEGRLVGTVMAGYDGHRGWIYSLAVAKDCRSQGVGSRLLQVAEARLEARGCVKINLQIIEGNDVAGFYAAHGYVVEPRVSMGKRLI